MPELTIFVSSGNLSVTKIVTPAVWFSSLILIKDLIDPSLSNRVSSVNIIFFFMMLNGYQFKKWEVNDENNL